MKVSKLIGLNVITEDAYTLGEVDGAQASTVTWQITHLNVALTKEATHELGFKKPILGSLTICLPTSAIKNIGDVITLRFSLNVFKNLEECQVE